VIVPGDPARKASPSACPGARPTHWARKVAPQQQRGNADKIPIPSAVVKPKALKPNKVLLHLSKIIN